MQTNNENQGNKHSKNVTYSAMCLAMCLVLPFLTGQIPQIGNALCPMHLPVFLAAFMCGPWWAGMVGLIAPMLRHLIFGMPMFLAAIGMCFELATYGIVAGVLYRRMRGKRFAIYGSLVTAMAAGRIVWGAVRVILTGVTGEAFTWSMFMAGAFTTAIPGIIVQLILIPILVTALKKAKIIL